MKKKVIWVIVLALISAYSLLTWVQYQYYDRVLGLRQEGMRRQMKEALRTATSPTWSSTRARSPA